LILILPNITTTAAGNRWGGSVLSGHVFSLGFDNSQEWGNESDLSYDWNQYMVLPHVLGQKTDRVNGWYLQDQASWGQRLFLSSGARWDRHDLYGGRASWRLAPAYLVPSLNTKLKATAGTGWTTPTLYQRFDPLSGNASLLPERSLSCDVGFEQPFMGNRLRLEAVYFNNHIQNCIGFDSTLVTAQTPWGEFSNTNRVHSRGCESTLTAQYFKDGAFHLGYSYTDSKNEDTHTQLANVAQNRASFSLDTPSFHNAHAGFEMLYTGKRLYSSQITLPDYTLARLRVEWKPSGRITLFGRIENLFDRRYQEVYGYQTSPRAYYAGSTLQL
jgi:vitamin B12 transporter